MKNGFPKDFLWGGALAGCQAEGAYSEEGRTMSLQDLLTFDDKNDRRITKQAPLTKELIEERKKDTDIIKYPKRREIDFYHTYKDDIALFGELGFKVFRYSISWSRVFPNGDDLEPNEKALEFYDNVIGECLKYGMEPLITISHFDMPLVLVEKF